MSITNYPSYLPKVSNAYNVAANTNVIRTQFDTGKYRQRQRFENVTYNLNVKWEFTDDEYLLFEIFHRGSLKNGTEYFNIDLALTNGIRNLEARFVGADYKATYKGNLNWDVTATLEVEDIEGSDDSLVTLIESIVGEGQLSELETFFMTSNRLNVLVNQTIPQKFNNT